MNGFLNVLKPPGMTSHDVVNFIRKNTGIKKVGHTGTLDPEAAGVLPICVGKATKAAQYIVDSRKKYRANIKFGIETDTQDKYGKIINVSEVRDIQLIDFEKMISAFIGRIKQTPPLYSAIKYEGKRLYQYAHEGKQPPIKTREIEIYNMTVIDKLSNDEFMLDITCSKGTYIRTLCNDIGEKSGYGAHMSQLIRLESYPFNIDSTITLEEIQTAAESNYLSDFIIDTDYILTRYEKISIKENAEKSVLNGNPISDFGIYENIQQYKLNTKLRLYIDNRFIGIGEIDFDEKNEKNYIKIKTLFV